MSSQVDPQSAVQMAQQEMEYRVDLFNRYGLFSNTSILFYTMFYTMLEMETCRMVSSCYDKCMDKRYVCMMPRVVKRSRLISHNHSDECVILHSHSLLVHDWMPFPSSNLDDEGQGQLARLTLTPQWYY